MPRKPKASQPMLPAPEFKPPIWWNQCLPFAKDYVIARDERMEATEIESEAKSLLMEKIKFFNSDKLPMGKFDHDGVCIEITAENIKMRVRVEEQPFTESDPNQLAIDGTVHPEDDDDSDGGETPSSELAEDLTAMRDRLTEHLSDSPDAA